MYKVVARSERGSMDLSEILELNECISVIDDYMKEPQPEDEDYKWIRKSRKSAALIYKGKQVIERMIIVKAK